MKKIVLVPHAKFMQMKECETRNRSSSVMESVQRPEQQLMIKKFNMAQQALEDPSKTKEEQVSMYNDSMNEFSILRDRIKQVPSVQKKSNIVSEDVVSVMPVSLQSSARNLMDRLRRNEDAISWTPLGEVSIHGQKLPGVNITDLVSDVIRASKSEVPDRDRFLRILSELNTPEAFIKNKTALAHYRRIKNTSVLNRPPGIPQNQLELNNMSLLSSDDEGMPGKKKKKKTPSKYVDPKSINWENL